MNPKKLRKLVEIENRINETKRQIASGETDPISVNPFLEQCRLVRTFLLADIKRRFQTHPDDTFIESFQTPSQLIPIAQIASSAIVSVLADKHHDSDTLGVAWYLEFDNAMTLHPACQIFSPVHWWRVSEQERQAMKECFGTDIMHGQGCTDTAKVAAVTEVAKQRIQTLGALPWIRFTTLGAFRFAYRNMRNGSAA